MPFTFQGRMLVIPVHGEPWQPGATHDMGGEPLPDPIQLAPPVLTVMEVTREMADSWLRVRKPGYQPALFLEERGEITYSSAWPLAGASILDIAAMNLSGGKTNVDLKIPDTAAVFRFGEEQADNAVHAVVALRSVIGENVDPDAAKGEYNPRYTPAVVLNGHTGQVMAGAGALGDELPLVMMVVLEGHTVWIN